MEDVLEGLSNPEIAGSESLMEEVEAEEGLLVLEGENNPAAAPNVVIDIGMLSSANLYPFQLSGGMKQRVAIARAFVLNSDILLLDEPFGALDQHRRMQLQKMLLDLWQHGNNEGEKRKTVVFVTHDIDEAILLADRIFFMRPGKIVKTIEIDFNKDHDAATLAQLPKFGEVRKELLELFALDDGLEQDYED